jgi:hypothetical protein
MTEKLAELFEETTAAAAERPARGPRKRVLN